MYNALNDDFALYHTLTYLSAWHYTKFILAERQVIWMVTVLIVEDNVEQLHSLELVLKNEFSDMTCLTAADYESAKRLIDTREISLFLLDIELQPADTEHTGVQLGQYIRSMPKHAHTPILFLTAIMNQINTALNTTHCYSYLLKPYRFEDLLHTVRELLHSPMMQTVTYLSVRDTNGIYFQIYFDDLLYIKSSGKVLYFTTENGSVVTRDFSMEQLAGLLPEYFCRCHKSYIVNIRKVMNYDKTNQRLTMQFASNDQIAVGRKYKTTFEKDFEEYA